MQILDPKHPFFALKWRRWATSLFPLLMAGVELYSGSPGWAMLFGAAGLYAFYRLILTFPPD